MKICELCGSVTEEENQTASTEKVRSLHLCESCLECLPVHQWQEE
jgi:ribosome-binding protein aMBF1 (putative translation factor)